MTTVAMHESKVLLAHECVTTVIRNPLLRLGLERIHDDLGLTSVTHHDGSVGLGDMSPTDLLIAELSMISADQLRRLDISAVIIVREDEIEALSEAAGLPSCAFALKSDISPGLLGDLALKAPAGETAVSPTLDVRRSPTSTGRPADGRLRARLRRARSSFYSETA